MSTLRFVIRPDKIDKNFKCPIELIYQISGQRKKLFLDYKINPINWDADQGCCQYVQPAKAKKAAPADQLKTIGSWLLDDSEVREINESITGVRSAVREVEKRFEMDKIVYSAEMVMQKLKEDQSQKTKKEDHKSFVFDFMDQYISDHVNSRVKGSLTVYKSVKSHLKAYQDYSKLTVRFDSIDYAFFQRFQNFLINHRNINNTTIAKALSTLKTFLGYARKQGIKVNDSYRDFQIKREKLEVIALTAEELQKLLNKDLENNNRLRGVRDIFCFACATGLRYSDLAQLKHEHINNKEIRLVVKKTKSELFIPLNPISASILKKYTDKSKPLPMISAQRLNDYIKELCKLCDIDSPTEIVRFRGALREATTYPKFQLIHAHTARKTFVTLSLEKGMNAEHVMAITGHSDYKSFKRYVEVTNKTTRSAMERTWGTLEK